MFINHKYSKAYFLQNKDKQKTNKQKQKHKNNFNTITILQISNFLWKVNVDILYMIIL
jgi:hypothetical protein